MSNRAEKNKLGKNRCSSRHQNDFPFSSLSVLVKYNNISVVQTFLMVPASKMKPQTQNPFIFVLLLIFHRSCQLGLSLISQSIFACWEKWKMRNLTENHVSISAISLPLHCIGKRKSHEHVSILMILISAFYDLCPFVSRWKKII